MPLSPSTSASEPMALPGRAFEEVVKFVRRQISSGELKEGDRLPAERDFAERLGVGRNVVREAFRSLENGGVIELRKGRNGGAYILKPDGKRLVHAIQDLHDMGVVGLHELTEARVLLADQIVRLAVQRANEDDFEAMEADIQLLDDLTAQGLIEERSMRATNFFHLIAKSTGNRALVLLESSLSEIIRRFVEVAMRGGRPQLATLSDSRRKILAHLRARDADRASSELRTQLLDLHQNLMRLIPGRANALPQAVQPPAKRAARKVAARRKTS